MAFALKEALVEVVEWMEDEDEDFDRTEELEVNSTS